MAVAPTDSLGVPIVLLHGMGSGPGVWDEVSPWLEEVAPVHAVRLLGHSDRTGVSTSRLTLEAMLDDLEHQLDQRGIDAAHLVGNSIGGWLALALAERSRAATVTCFAPAGGWPPGGWFEQTLVARFALGHLTLRALWGIMPSIVSSSRGRQLALGLMAAHAERIGPGRALETLSELARCRAVLPVCMQVRDRGFAHLPSTEVPVLIAWSGRDRVLGKRRAQARFAELEPPAAKLTLADVGHVPMLDDPHLVASVILDHIETGGRRHRPPPSDVLDGYGPWHWMPNSDSPNPSA